MRYQFLINVQKDPQGRNVGFFGYEQGHTLELGYSGDVPEHHGRENDLTVCDILYETFNINHPGDYRNRSMSVGDVVLLDHSRAYSCERTGWKRIAVTTHILTVAEVKPFVTTLTEEQQSVLTQLRKAKCEMLAHCTEEHWKRGEAYYIDDRVNVSKRLRAAFNKANPKDGEQ